MRIVIIIISFLTTASSYSQMRPIDKVYIVEGIVADRDSMKVVADAILYNDSLGITTTSDENGYFKLVIPYNFFKNRNVIPIDIVKSGYKRIGSGIMHNLDTNYDNSIDKIIWNYDVKIFWIAKVESRLSSASSANVPVKEGAHGPSAIKLVFDKAVASDIREKKFDLLKEGNEKVYFPLDGQIGLATARYDIIVVGKLSNVFINDKKVAVTDINSLVKRSQFLYDRPKSDELSKKYGRETLAFTTSATATNDPSSIKATLVIHVEN